MNNRMVRVKFISRLPASEWPRYFPQEDFVWKSCRFTFDREARDYDWLVIYDDISPVAGGSARDAQEVLACPPENTLLVTTEPSSIKTYGWHYTRQFGHVLTTQPEWALPHSRRHWQQSANLWFYGGDPKNPMGRERLVAGPGTKTGMVSMVGSKKAQSHTMHAARFAFIQRMQELMPEMEVYGRGYRALADKADALDPYRYHVCAENHIAPHHWTEKLSDAFLGRCLPFYAGAPDAADYFPEGSFVAIDMRKPEEAAALVRRAVAEGWYEQRLPLIEEARRRVLEEYHLFAVIERLIAQADTVPHASGMQQTVLLSRHALRRSAVVALYHLFEKIYVRLRTFFEKMSEH